MHDALRHNPSPADCATIRALVDDVVAEACDAVSAARVEAHTADCAGCRLALAAARAYRRAMRRVGEAVRASDALRQRALNALREVRGSQTN